MIYLLLAIISSTLVSVLMRMGENKIKNEMMMFSANYAMCVIFSYAMANQSSLVLNDSITIVMGIICGVLFLASFVLMKINMKYNGIVLTSTFTKLGVLIPTLMTIIIFKELPSFLQIIGVLLACIAIVIIQFEKSAINEGNKKNLIIDYFNN